ncbi:hypothetical protein ACFWPX_19815 [Nocardia sp. NPDC058518]|uniref:hypothetical protein n=1 Tax=Nocardia sp. NPDC058518 TaxID=3346534 RepID=UPI00364A3F07
MTVLNSPVEGIRGQNVDSLLDDGASGLQYFIQLLPMYIKAFEKCSHTEAQICDKYDEQRGMNLDKLADTAEALYNALQVSDTQWGVQQGLSQKMSTVWSSGSAAEAASTMLGQQLTLATEDRAKLTTAVEAFATATTKLRGLVTTKKDWVKALVTGNQVLVGGKTVADIDRMIEETDIWDVGTIGVGVVASVIPGLGSAYSAKTAYDKQQSEAWLKDVFKPDFDGKLTNFLSLCSNTDDTVKLAYGVLTTATNALDSGAYPRPAGTVTADGTTPAGTTPAGTTPTTTTPATTTTPTTTTPTTTTPTTTTPSTTTDDTISEIVSTVTEAATELLTTAASTLSENMDTITSTITEGIENAVGQLESVFQDADGDGVPDVVDGKSAEFDVAGNNVKVEMGEDGNLKMVVTGADGQSTEYGMTIGADGQPVITTESGEPIGDGEAAGDGEATGDDSATEGVVGDGTPSSGSGTAEQGGTPASSMPGMSGATKREDDGEHYSQPLPAGDTEEPVDTGAVLAEAGPL